LGADPELSRHEHGLRFAATRDGLEHGALALRDLLDAQHVGGGSRYNVELAFEEVATNIVRHGAPTSDVEFTIVFGVDEIVMTFRDDGIPFDPRAHPAPVAPTSIDDAPIGGLGLVLLRTISTRMEYERTPQDCNLLTIVIPA
jgi:serine/threonine-protein kinase RsbW